MNEPIHWNKLTPAERDKVVAQAIGWAPYVCPVEELHTCCARCGFVPMYDKATEYRHITAVPKFSTSLDAAWLVIQEIEEHHDELHSPFAYRLGVTYADRDGFDVFEMNLQQLANLTPEVICVAALKTLGHDVQTEQQLIAFNSVPRLLWL